MKAIVVTDEAAGTAGMTLVEPGERQLSSRQRTALVKNIS
jgi:hypothetical protein